MKTQKIIVQDSDEDVLETLRLVLEEKQYKVLPFTDCRHILVAIDIFRPHVVMLDYKLSGKDCIEACQKIKAKFPHLPVLALSCNTNIHEIYSHNGFDDYISKPFDIHDLYATLRKHIKFPEPEMSSTPQQSS